MFVIDRMFAGESFEMPNVRSLTREHYYIL